MVGKRKSKKSALILPARFAKDSKGEEVSIRWAPGTRSFYFNDRRLSLDTIITFFKLSTMNKILRFASEPGTDTVSITPVPDDIEEFYNEILRIVDKYKDDPLRGFNLIRLATRFAEKIKTALAEKEKAEEEVKDGS